MPIVPRHTAEFAPTTAAELEQWILETAEELALMQMEQFLSELGPIEIEEDRDNG